MPLEGSSTFFALLLTVSIAPFTCSCTALSALYEYNDPGSSCASCNNPTPTTDECSCPSGSVVLRNQTPLRVLNACAGHVHGAHIATCQTSSPGSRLRDVYAHYGGSYQMDDSTPHSLGCRSVNPLTGGCSCPSESAFSEQTFRVLVDTLDPGDVIGSTICMCVNTSSERGNGGGMYMTDTETGECLTTNPRSGGCSCDNSQGHKYRSVPLQIIYPSATGALRNATWSVCTLAMPTEICPGVFAVLDGIEDVTVAVMQCINNTEEFKALLLPSGRYGVASQIVIDKSITIGTAGVSLTDSRICSISDVSCASFVGLQKCCDDGGIVNVLAPNVVMNHIVIDGNREMRRDSASWNECLSNRDNRGNAVNARVSNVKNVSFLYSASINALCASGFQWQGDNCHIGYSYFANNGNHGDGRWSDGLTLLSCQHGYVHDLVLVDNTDVNLVCGCGAGFLIENLDIKHIIASSFAGFMLDNFDSSQCGNYSGGVVRNVSIDCGSFQCDFGANFGPHPWYASSNIAGGSVSMMTVSGAKQGVNCAGAGTSHNPLFLDAITVLGTTPAANEFQCGVHETSAFNVATDSVVTTTNCPSHTSFPWKACP